jgi:hypothetical protein
VCHIMTSPEPLVTKTFHPKEGSERLLFDQRAAIPLAINTIVAISSYPLLFSLKVLIVRGGTIVSSFLYAIVPSLISLEQGSGPLSKLAAATPYLRTRPTYSNYCDLIYFSGENGLL